MWEYTYVNMFDVSVEDGKEYEIRALGAEGWEMVCFAGNRLWFKRQKTVFWSLYVTTPGETNITTKTSTVNQTTFNTTLQMPLPNRDSYLRDLEEAVYHASHCTPWPGALYSSVEKACQNVENRKNV